MPVIFFHRTRKSTEYTVLKHIGVWVKTKINTITSVDLGVNHVNQVNIFKIVYLFASALPAVKIGLKLPLACSHQVSSVVWW